MKKLKKLVLKKESVINLDSKQLNEVKGGIIGTYLDCTVSCDIRCEIASREPACSMNCVSDNCTAGCYSANEVWTCGPGVWTYNCNTDFATCNC